MAIGLIIRTNGEIEEFDYEEDVKQLQKIVGGYIEPIGFSTKPYFCYANEEAKILGLEENKLATDLWYNSGQVVMLGDYIAGTVIFFGLISFEGWDTDYPEKLINDLSKYTK